MIYINNKEKLNKIRQEKDIFIITDFDRTLTTKESEPSMGIIPEYLGGKCLEKRQKIFNHYRPVELDYTLEPTIKQKYMRDWARESFTLLCDFTTKEVIHKSIENANLHLRDGAIEFLQNLNKNNIPVIIMSSGFGNIVEEFLKKENCLFNNMHIVSNFFKFDKNKAIINLEEIMATSNKEYERIPGDLKCKIENKKAGLLFGDLVEDLKMAKQENLDKILTFGFLDTNIKNNISEFNNNFDVVLTKNESFETVINILNN